MERLILTFERQILTVEDLFVFLNTRGHLKQEPDFSAKTTKPLKLGMPRFLPQLQSAVFLCKL